MSILNYSTGISAEKTAGEIQAKLSRAKAQAVLCEYDKDGVLYAMSFRIDTKHGLLSYRLPINIDGVLGAMSKDKKIPRSFKNREQASRVAWRILKDWIEAQLAFVESEQVDIKQVFLSYLQNPQTGQTLYETISGNGFKQLTQ